MPVPCADWADARVFAVLLASVAAAGCSSSGEPTTVDDIIAREGIGTDEPVGGGLDVNLIVSSFAIDRDLTPGSDETISAIIQNVGEDLLQFSGLNAPDAIRVGYFLSTDETVTVDDIFLGDTSIVVGTYFVVGDVPFGFESLSPGEIYQFDHPLSLRANIPAGRYYVGAIVDFVDDYEWYDFARSTDTSEFTFPAYGPIPETDESDNVRVLPAYRVTVAGSACADDAYEPDSEFGAAKAIAVGQTQSRNFCRDNADWLRFEADEGNIYKITTSALESEADTQLVLYDQDGSSILLFNDNILHDDFFTECGILYTVDLECNYPPRPESEMVWEAPANGTYFIRVRLTTCDEDKDPHCFVSPDGPGLQTGYNISLQ